MQERNEHYFRKKRLNTTISSSSHVVREIENNFINVENSTTTMATTTTAATTPSPEITSNFIHVRGSSRGRRQATEIITAGLSFAAGAVVEKWLTNGEIETINKKLVNLNKEDKLFIKYFN